MRSISSSVISLLEIIFESFKECIDVLLSGWNLVIISCVKTIVFVHDWLVRLVSFTAIVENSSSGLVPLKQQMVLCVLAQETTINVSWPNWYLVCLIELLLDTMILICVVWNIRINSVLHDWLLHSVAGEYVCYNWCAMWLLKRNIATIVAIVWCASASLLICIVWLDGLIILHYLSGMPSSVVLLICHLKRHLHVWTFDLLC